MTAVDEAAREGLSWIEQLIDIGNVLGGVELELPTDEPASAADFKDI